MFRCMVYLHIYLYFSLNFDRRRALALRLLQRLTLRSSPTNILRCRSPRTQANEQQKSIIYIDSREFLGERKTSGNHFKLSYHVS